MDNSEPPTNSTRDGNSVPLVSIQPPTSPTAVPPSPSQQSSTRNRIRPTPTLQRQPSIRIRRLPSSQGLGRVNTQTSTDGHVEPTGRRRSSSAPQGSRSQYLQPPRPGQAPEAFNMAPLVEEDSRPDRTPPPQPSAPDYLAVPEASAGPTTRVGRMRSVSNAAARSALGSLQRLRTNSPGPTEQELRDREYESEIVDLLDVVDPEVSALSSLTNVQNSLFIPNLGRYGRFLNRTPTYNLSGRERPTTIQEAETPPPDYPLSLVTTPVEVLRQQPATDDEEFQDAQETQEEDADILRQPTTQQRLDRTHSITSVLSDSHYAVLPHGVSLEGWTEEDKEMLNDHVRHMLHSKKEKFKRGWKGFRQYIRKPLGLFVTVYAILITLFGLAWVLFLIGWINIKGRQSYLINVIDNVLVALFALVGDTLAPFRAVDTYHMIYIAHYHHLTWRLRREKAMPRLPDENDLPSDTPGKDIDLEAAETNESHELSVLTPRQQEKLVHHQTKFSKSHTFYRPHETPTHHAFPLRLLVAVVVLLDFHSIFQIALGACTWGISYHTRPQALTAVILSCSICCNISGGIVITVGDHKTRKKDVIERQFRQGLTEQAMDKVKKKRIKSRVETGHMGHGGALKSD